MQLISCLILIVSDCVWVILCWVIWPWLIWPWLIWFTSTWLILGWLIMEWLEVMWLIRTAVTSGCEWIGLLLNWFPKAVWPSLDGNELWMVQKRSTGVISGQVRDSLIVPKQGQLTKAISHSDCTKKGRLGSNEVKFWTNDLGEIVLEFSAQIFNPVRFENLCNHP